MTCASYRNRFTVLDVVVAMAMALGPGILIGRSQQTRGHDSGGRSPSVDPLARRCLFVRVWSGMRLLLSSEARAVCNGGKGRARETVEVGPTRGHHGLATSGPEYLVRSTRYRDETVCITKPCSECRQPGRRKASTSYVIPSRLSKFPVRWQTHR